MKNKIQTTSFKKGHKQSVATKLKISLSKSKGRTEIQGLIRKNSKYIQWRSDVFKRDNYRCNKCTSKISLNAHHIIPLKEIIKAFKIKNTCDSINCDELWDVGNGITLCGECHKKEHGRKINGKEI